MSIFDRKGVSVDSSFTYNQENCGSITWSPAEHVARKYNKMTDLEREFHDKVVRLALRGLAHGLAGNMLMPEPDQRAHLHDHLIEKLAEFKADATAYVEKTRRSDT